MTNDTLYRPTVSDHVTDGFNTDRGPTHSPRYHQGIDIGVPVGTPLYASGVGVVVSVGNTGNTRGYGRNIVVRYQVGKLTVRVRLAHMSAVDVKVGDAVTLTTRLGLSGGRRGADGAGASGGPHVHIEVTTTGFQDPDDYLNSRFTIADGGATPITESEQEHDMKLYEDAGNGQWVGKGALYVAGDGKFRPIDPHVPNVRAVATAAFGAPIAMMSADLAWVRAQYLDIPAVGATTISDDQVQALASALVAAVGDDDDDLTLDQLKAELAGQPSQLADALAARLAQ